MVTTRTNHCSVALFAFIKREMVKSTTKSIQLALKAILYVYAMVGRVLSFDELQLAQLSAQGEISKPRNRTRSVLSLLISLRRH